MKEPTLIEKIIESVIGIPIFIEQSLCQHNKIFTNYTAEIFTIEKYERCSGAGNCMKCGKGFSVYVPENDEEVNKLMAQ